MGKTKQPKKQVVRENPNAKDMDANMQDAPRKYRQLKKILDLRARKPEKPVKKTTTDSLNDIRKQVNLTAKRQTKKYEKRKSFLESKTKKREVDDEVKLVDHIKFGEYVQAPPKLTAIPKKKGYIKQPKPVITKKPVISIPLAKKSEVSESIGRKTKQKDLSESDRKALLKDRQRAIDYYRSKKSQP